MSKNSKCPLDCAVKGCGINLCRRYKDYKQGEKDGIRNTLDEVYAIALNESHDTLIEWLQNNIVD